MTTSPTAHRSPEPSVRRMALIVAVTAVAFAAVIVLAATLVSLPHSAGYGRVPDPEPAPAPIQR
jgi:hypothetical protein